MSNENWAEWQAFFGSNEPCGLVPNEIMHNFPKVVDSDEIYMIRTDADDVCKRVRENRLCDDSDHCTKIHPDFVNTLWAPLNLTCHKHFEGECSRRQHNILLELPRQNDLVEAIRNGFQIQ